MNPRRASAGDGRRSLSIAGIAPADLLAGLGLIVVGALSLALLTGNLPLVPGDGGGGGGDGGPVRTPTPSNVVIVDPRADVPGTILYVKAGNIWLQRGPKATALTSGGRDSMPSFSADGQWIYFIRTTDEPGRWSINNLTRRFLLATPSLMRIQVDGLDEPESLLTGRIETGAFTWSYFIRQPVASPDGATVVLVTDGPNPSKSDVVLKELDLATGKLRSLDAPEVEPLGHQDPAWSPDGRYVLFVKNVRDGSRGAPVIMRYDMTTGKSATLTGPGYTSPAWSPDGRYIAATRTTSFGTDVVILDAQHGAELLRVTKDERSFAPVWSPAGNTLAYLSIDGGVTDLWLVGISATATPSLVGDPLGLTLSAGLDPASRPGWWIPADELPTPAPTTPTTLVPTPTAPAGQTPTGSVAP